MGGEFTWVGPAVKWKPMPAIKKEESRNPTRSGHFVVLEGIDGSGKTTAWNRLKDRLAGQPGFLFLREPTELPTGLRIRACLQGREPPPRTDAEWTALFLQDRKENVSQNVEPALQAGKTVIQDRYKYSTAAYQAENQQKARKLLQDQKEFPEPDILIYLELSAEDALKRIDRRSESREHFETLERLQRISQNYDSLLPDSCIRIDAQLSPENIEARLLEVIQKII